MRVSAQVPSTYQCPTLKNDHVRVRQPQVPNLLPSSCLPTMHFMNHFPQSNFSKISPPWPSTLPNPQTKPNPNPHPSHPSTQILHPTSQMKPLIHFPIKHHKSSSPQTQVDKYLQYSPLEGLDSLQCPTENRSVIPLSNPLEPNLPQVNPQFDQFPPLPAFPQSPPYVSNSPTVSLIYVTQHLNPCKTLVSAQNRQPKPTPSHFPPPKHTHFFHTLNQSEVLV